jgi:hypothetical protein
MSFYGVIYMKTRSLFGMRYIVLPAKPADFEHRKVIDTSQSLDDTMYCECKPLVCLVIVDNPPIPYIDSSKYICEALECHTLLGLPSFCTWPTA